MSHSVQVYVCVCVRCHCWLLIEKHMNIIHTYSRMNMKSPWSWKHEKSIKITKPTFRNFFSISNTPTTRDEKKWCKWFLEADWKSLQTNSIEFIRRKCEFDLHFKVFSDSQTNWHLREKWTHFKRSLAFKWHKFVATENLTQSFQVDLKSLYSCSIKSISMMLNLIHKFKSFQIDKTKQKMVRDMCMLASFRVFNHFVTNSKNDRQSAMKCHMVLCFFSVCLLKNDERAVHSDARASSWWFRSRSISYAYSWSACALHSTFSSSGNSYSYFAHE